MTGESTERRDESHVVRHFRNHGLKQTYGSFLGPTPCLCYVMLDHVIRYIADFLSFSEAHHASRACRTVLNCPDIQSRLTTRAYAEEVWHARRENARLLDELIATETEIARQIRRARRRARKPTLELGASAEPNSDVYSCDSSYTVVLDELI